MTKRKFQLNDKVKVIKTGKIGVIGLVWGYPRIKYYVHCDKNTSSFYSYELEKIEQENNHNVEKKKSLPIQLCKFREQDMKNSAQNTRVPHTLEEYKRYFYPFEKHTHYVPDFAHGFSKDDCDALIAYGRLLRLYRSWLSSIQEKFAEDAYYIKHVEYASENCNFIVDAYMHCHGIRHFLAFPTREMAIDFMKNFNDLLEEAKDLI